MARCKCEPVAVFFLLLLTTSLRLLITEKKSISRFFICSSINSHTFASFLMLKVNWTMDNVRQNHLTDQPFYWWQTQTNHTYCITNRNDEFYQCTYSISSGFAYWFMWTSRSSVKCLLLELIYSIAQDERKTFIILVFSLYYTHQWSIEFVWMEKFNVPERYTFRNPHIFEIRVKNWVFA